MPLLYGRIFKPRKRRRRKYSTLKATTYTVGPCSSYTPPEQIQKEQIQTIDTSVSAVNNPYQHTTDPPIAEKQQEAMGTAINNARKYEDIDGVRYFTNVHDYLQAKLENIAEDEECP